MRGADDNDPAMLGNPVEFPHDRKRVAQVLQYVVGFYQVELVVGNRVGQFLEVVDNLRADVGTDIEIDVPFLSELSAADVEPFHGGPSATLRVLSHEEIGGRVLGGHLPSGPVP